MREVGEDGFLVRKKRAPVRVRVEWMRLWPGQGLRFWGVVAGLVRARKVRATDLVRVRQICAEVDGKLMGRRS